MNMPCSCYGVYGHYMHDFPLLPYMNHMWESQEVVRGHKTSPSVPPSPAPSQLAVFTNHFPQQGFVATQPPQGQVATQPLPSSTSNYQFS